MRSALHLALFGAILALVLVLLPGKQGGRGGSSAPTLSSANGTNEDPFDARPPLPASSERKTVRSAQDSTPNAFSGRGWIPVPPAWMAARVPNALVIGIVTDAEERPLAGVEVTCSLWADGLEWLHARCESDEQGAFEMSVATGDVSRWVHALRGAAFTPREKAAREPGIRITSTGTARAWPDLRRVGVQIRARDQEGSVAVQDFCCLPAEGARMQVRLRMSSDPNLEGTVVNALGFGVQGAWVGLAQPNGELYGEPQRTGENGEFSLSTGHRGHSGQVDLLAWEAKLGQARLPAVELPRAHDAARLEISLSGDATTCPFEKRLPGVAVGVPGPRSEGDDSLATARAPTGAPQPGLWVHLEQTAAARIEPDARTSPQTELFLGSLSGKSELEPLEWSLQPADLRLDAAPLLPCCGGAIFSTPPLPAGRYRMRMRMGGVEGAQREFDLGPDRRVVVEFDLAHESEAEDR